MKIFDSYDNKNLEKQPENIFRFLKIKDIDFDIITRGASVTHYFTVPFYFKDVKDIIVTYKQGLSIVIEKKLVDCSVDELESSFILQVKLSPEESQLFNSFNKDTHIQLAVSLQSDTVVYSDKYRLKVIASLNSEPFREEEEKE